MTTYRVKSYVNADTLVEAENILEALNKVTLSRMSVEEIYSIEED